MHGGRGGGVALGGGQFMRGCHPVQGAAIAREKSFAAARDDWLVLDQSRSAKVLTVNN